MTPVVHNTRRCIETLDACHIKPSDDVRTSGKIFKNWKVTYLVTVVLVCYTWINYFLRSYDICRGLVKGCPHLVTVRHKSVDKRLWRGTGFFST
jgi:hypothetical protein